jgi:hypothetical protein
MSTERRESTGFDDESKLFFIPSCLSDARFPKRALCASCHAVGLRLCLAAYIVAFTNALLTFV